MYPCLVYTKIASTSRLLAAVTTKLMIRTRMYRYMISHEIKCRFSNIFLSTKQNGMKNVDLASTFGQWVGKRVYPSEQH